MEEATHAQCGKTLGAAAETIGRGRARVMSMTSEEFLAATIRACALGRMLARRPADHEAFRALEEEAERRLSASVKPTPKRELAR
jgi:hypothetical protein